jgi:general stress protein 26
MLHAQPLTTHNREATADNLLYFLVSPRSAAAVDLRGGSSRVVVMYADPEYDRYACISGPARIWRDPDLQTQLLSVFAPAHFPIRNDLELQLIAVRIEAVNFSDARTVSAALET